MKYVIFEDKMGATEVKIHKQTCGFFKRQLQTKPETTIWYEGFDSDSAINEAKNIASRHKKGWKIAKCCENSE